MGTCANCLCRWARLYKPAMCWVLPVKVSRAAVGLPDITPTPTPPPPPAGTIDGFGFATALTISGGQGVVTSAGINLRSQASRTAPPIGLVKGGSTVTILGGQQGEYF